MKQTHFITIAAVEEEGVARQTLIDQAKASLPGSHFIGATTIDTEVFDPESASEEAGRDAQSHALPLSIYDAQDFANDEGVLDLIIAVDQEDYMTAFVQGSQTTYADDHFDLLREEAFDFQEEVETQTATIVAADAQDFLVHYQCKFKNL